MSRRKVYWALAAALMACSCWVGQAISGQGGQPAAIGAAETGAAAVGNG